MGGDLGGLLSIALAIVSIATLAGLGLMRGIVTNLREQLRDEREARESDRKKRDEAEAEHLKYKAETEAHIAELEADRTVLRRTVTGEVHLVALADRLEDLIKQVTALWEFVTGKRRGDEQ